MYCKKCGHELKDDWKNWKYCPVCSSKLTSNSVGSDKIKNLENKNVKKMEFNVKNVETNKEKIIENNKPGVIIWSLISLIGIVGSIISLFKGSNLTIIFFLIFIIATVTLSMNYKNNSITKTLLILLVIVYIMGIIIMIVLLFQCISAMQRCPG